MTGKVEKSSQGLGTLSGFQNDFETWGLSVLMETSLEFKRIDILQGYTKTKGIQTCISPCV
jgi:hypothetical protein